MNRSRKKSPGIRAQRRADKQARIMAAARALLRDQGHERFSLRQVAQHARMSPAGMYEFFDNREHLLDTLAAEANEALVATLRAAMADAPDPAERMVRLGLAYIDFAREHPRDFMLLFGRLSARRSLAEEVPENTEYTVIRDAVADVVGAGKSDGHSQQYHELLAYGFWSSIHGMAVLQITHLADFGADFPAAHRLLLTGMAQSWQQADWTKVAGLPDDNGDTDNGIHQPGS